MHNSKEVGIRSLSEIAKLQNEADMQNKQKHRNIFILFVDNQKYFYET